MKKKILSILAVVLVFAMLTMLLSMVFATNPAGIAVNGNLDFAAPAVYSYRKELPNGRHSVGTTFQMFTGDIYGPAEGELVYNQHYNGGPPGGTIRPGVTISGRNFNTITVLEFLGEPATGTITILMTASNRQWRIVSGTGDFENLHGSGIFTPDDSTPSPTDSLYSGTVFFAP